MTPILDRHQDQNIHGNPDLDTLTASSRLPAGRSAALDSAAIDELQRLADLSNQGHRDTQSRARSTLDRMIDVGGHLCRAKDLVEHGNLARWVAENLSFGMRQAQFYMRAYRDREKLKLLLRDNPGEVRGATALRAMLMPPRPKTVEPNTNNSAHLPAPDKPPAAAEQSDLVNVYGAEPRNLGEGSKESQERARLSALRRRRSWEVVEQPPPSPASPLPAECQDRPTSKKANCFGQPSPSEPVPEEEWLENLPLSRILTGEPLKCFKRDALLYRRLTPSRQEFARQAYRLTGRNIGKLSYGWSLDRFLGTPEPEEWVACPPETEGGCNRAGIIRSFQSQERCPCCYGRGYLQRPPRSTI